MILTECEEMRLNVDSLTSCLNRFLFASGQRSAHVPVVMAGRRLVADS